MVVLCDSRTHQKLFQGGGQGQIGAAIALLHRDGTLRCTVKKATVRREHDDGFDEWECDVLLAVELLDPVFQMDADTESLDHVTRLLRYWQRQADAAASGDTAEEAFAEELRQGWWQQQQLHGGQEEQQAQPGQQEHQEGQQEDDAQLEERQQAQQATAGDDSLGTRDRIFGMVAPTDWQLEAAEPLGLACTLYRYQRRCLAWLKWRESLGGGNSLAQERGPAESVGPAQAAQPAATAGAGGEGAVCPDSGSSKSKLQSTSLLWQPIVLPSGQTVFRNAADGCLRREAGGPPLPEVPGGLLCDEMGLGKTVEMMALFLARPPPPHWQLQPPVVQPEPGSQQQTASGPVGQPSGAAAGAAGAAAQAAEAAAARGAGGAGGAVPTGSGEPVTSSPSASTPAGLPGSSGQRGPLRGGTLVVCPPALLQQWQSELANHAHGALVCEVYDGLAGLQAALQKEGSKAKRLKPAQREMELHARRMAGEELQPSFDAQAEAAAALRRIEVADVVLTSFDVLRAEVHFVPSQRSLRHRKRYEVPHCPLLQVHWWRLVIDEAQMVGPLSAAGTMCERMVACHRWCVTGTPMGSHRSDELNDIQALLQTLKHQPLADPPVWRQLVAEPLAKASQLPHRAAAAEEAWRLLSRVLAPLMWRNTKAVAELEFRLPPRTLQLTWLSFQAGERAFYDQVVEKSREAREELASFRRRQQEGGEAAEGGDQPMASPGPRASKRTGSGRKAKKPQSERLEDAAADNVTQLRLACIHPQLTKDWRDMGAEGQLGVGATLSMQEIMQRLVDRAQSDLQEAERSLCAHLNTLAMRLVVRAEAASSGAGAGGSGSGKKARRQEAAEEEQEEEEGTAVEAASPRPSKRARLSKGKGGVDGAGAEEMLARALMLLEQSFRVAEKGIAAMDVSREQLGSMPDIVAASTSTVHAWKRLQINTARQLEKLYAAAGREEEACEMDRDAQEKAAYLRSQAEMELAQARQRLEQVQQVAEAARQAFQLHLEAATERGFPVWGLTRDATLWLAEVEGAYRNAQEEEQRELEAQQSKVKHLLGTRVAAALEELEKRLHTELTVLDRYVSEQQVAAAHRRLQREQGRWDDASAAVGGGGDAPQAVLEGGVDVLYELLGTLPDFRRKTLLAQHVALFSRQLADQAGRKREEAERRKKEQAAAKAAAVAAGADDGEAMGATAMESAEMVDAEERRQQDPQQQQEQGQEQQQVLQQQQAQQQQEPGQGQGGSAELAALLQAAESRQQFVASKCWRGRVEGYAFKQGDSGLGYYPDQPPQVEAFLTVIRLHTVAAAVGRHLLDHHRRLARAAGPDAALFASLALDAVEAKLESVKQQIHLVRSLRELHTAERSTALKAALQEDLDADLAAAARLPPLPGSTQVLKLQRDIGELREAAQSLLHRMRFMQSRVVEAGQLQPGSQTQQQQQQQQQQEEQQQDQQQQQQQQLQQDQDQDQQQQRVQQAAAGDSGAAPSNAPPPTAAAGTVQAQAGSSEASVVEVGLASSAVDRGPSSGLECPVCLSTVPAGTDIHVFSACGHAFCLDCSAKIVNEHGVCAVCRQRVTRKQVIRVVAGGGASTGAACDPDYEALGQIQPQGEWSSKVEALLRRLLHLASSAPAEKALVFSQFPDALKMTAMALQTNGIRFVELKSGREASRKVASFRDDDEVKVFLLAHKVGAQGLTLTRANHVFLLEPALEPAIEQQATARVHRIGQQRQVVVTRLLIQDTIEQRVLAVQEAKHSLFLGADGEEAADAELATSAAVRAEALGQHEVEGLLDDL